MTGAIAGAFSVLCGEQTYVVTASGEDRNKRLSRWIPNLGIFLWFTRGGHQLVGGGGWVPECTSTILSYAEPREDGHTSAELSFAVARASMTNGTFLP